MAIGQQLTLQFFGTSTELQNELRGDWVCDEKTSKLKHKGKTLVTWHPTTGTLLIQGKPHIARGIYDFFSNDIISQDKYKNRTREDLEHFKKNRFDASLKAHPYF